MKGFAPGHSAIQRFLVPSQRSCCTGLWLCDASMSPRMHLLVAGRAERLGLAISLVSRVPEKVWYCKQKGYKPWLKPKERDTRTHEEGGHTIWYHEQQLLKVSPAPSMELGKSGSPADRAEARA